MDRSFAARSPAGSRRSSLPADPGALSRRLRGPRRTLAGAAGGLAGRRRLRTAAICLAVALPALGGGWLWLRHSSLVAVEHVTITGARGPEARAIEAALRREARGMSTLAPNPAALQAAVRRFPAVSAVRAFPSFPHGMRIAVTQLPAVAALLVGGTRTAVSSGGVVLGASVPSSSLPTVADDAVPGPGSHLANPLVLEALTVLGAAPASLDRLAAKAYFGPRGLTVAMRDGLLVYFGDAIRPHAKWLSLASVLAAGGAAGATYVDVRLPGRPAAGFPPGAGPVGAEEAATGESKPGAGESTVSALAAGLAAANPETSAGGEAEEEGGGGTEASSEGGEEAEASSGESAAGGAEAGG
jgi:cell division protein FtsQ